ncbi:trypsin-like serine protease [Fragilaria crotonensis]|nr:trypsin-like serine protease [Fragilaria crotonensis]
MKKSGIVAVVVLLLGGHLGSAVRHQSNALQRSTGRNLENRIIGGAVANATRYPYYTYLLIVLTSGNILSCGGSLIAPDMVLSAAHCFSGFAYPVSRITACVNATSRESSKCQYKRDIVDFVLHPSYNFSKSTRRNDVALLKLNLPVTGVPLVKINKVLSTPATGASVTAIGLGKNNSDLTSSPDYLLEVAIKTVSYETCAASYAPVAIVQDTMLCAGGFKGPCSGDSGGPLTVIGKTSDLDVQVGITSFRPNLLCGLTDAPLGFTRVSFFAQWIDDQICQLSDSKPFACTGISVKPTAAPTVSKPSVKPTTFKPSFKPTTSKPTAKQPVTSKPSVKPSSTKPSLRPTTAKPSARPTTKPSARPTTKPSAKPTTKPTAKPTTKPSAKPTTKPSARPTTKPFARPTTKPSARPTTKPSARPTTKPSVKPSTVN